MAKEREKADLRKKNGMQPTTGIPDSEDSKSVKSSANGPGGSSKKKKRRSRRKRRSAKR